MKKKNNSQETKSRLNQETDELVSHSDSSPDTLKSKVKEIIQEEREERWERIKWVLNIIILIVLIAFTFYMFCYTFYNTGHQNGYSKGYEAGGINNQSYFTAIDFNYNYYRMNETRFCSDQCMMLFTIYGDNKHDYTKDSAIRILNLSEENCKRCE